MDDLRPAPETIDDSPITPMMAQYLAIKQGQPDCLLLYRMGDFYELFFEDAQKASATLGIALTKRGKHQGRDIPMCGVPVHAIDQYLQKLIRHGHRAAIAEQIEDPAEAKKRGAKSVVARQVVRVITPGTLMEDALLDSSSSNFLVCLAANSSASEMALAYADISTGEFAVMMTDLARLPADLARLSPSELLASDQVLSSPQFAPALGGQAFAISPLPNSRFDSQGAEHRLKSHFGVDSLDGFGSFRRVDVAALGALLEYISITQVGQVPHLREPRLERPEAGLLIDAATRSNLELSKTQRGERRGSLLDCIAETVTASGSRLLGEHLTMPLASSLAINARLDVVEHFVGAERLRDDMRRLLKSCPDLERALARITGGRAGPRDLAAIRDGLNASRAVMEYLVRQHDLSLRPQLLNQLVGQISNAPFEISQRLGEALATDLPYLARDGGFIAAGHLTALDENRKLRDETRQVIANLQAQYAEATGVKSLKIKHNNILGYFVEVTSQQADILKTSVMGQEFFHRQTNANAMRFSTSVLADLEQKIALAASRALALELEFFKAICDEVTAAKAAISQVARALAEIDVHAALAHLAGNRKYVRPQIDESLAFEIKGGRHPVVEQALAQQGLPGFSANDCDLADATRLWLLTGPNMAGKSTFLRQNALIAVMAQMGSFVSAASAHIGVIDRLYSRVGAADDLARGRSTFMVEMIETATILNQATSRSLVILDEIGRGTATYDGLSIAWATLEYLHDRPQARALFATHYHELTALSKTLKSLHCATMQVKEWKGDIVFMHEVVAGTATRSYGIQVAKLAGLPADVISRAGEILKGLEKNGGPKASSLLTDLPLFSDRKTVERKPDPLREKIDQLMPDSLSPRAALELLYELKVLARKDTDES
jgi:DNA mismatch repair protein MutS